MIESYIYICSFLCSLSLSLYVSRPSSRQAIWLSSGWHARRGRMTQGITAEQLRSAIARFSGDTVITLSRLLKSQDISSTSSGAFKRKVQASLAPYLACFRPVDVASSRTGASAEIFYIADMKALLRFVSSQCPSLQDVFRAHSADPLSAILAHGWMHVWKCAESSDETKLYYSMCLSLVWKPILKSSRAWFPVAAIHTTS